MSLADEKSFLIDTFPDSQLYIWPFDLFDEPALKFDIGSETFFLQSHIELMFWCGNKKLFIAIVMTDEFMIQALIEMMHLETK